MLGVIELHRDQLEKHQETLEQTVAQRTEELRGMIQALNQSKWQLESAGKAKSEFIANITHELRTPLIGVLGMNELLFRTPLNTEQQGLAGMVTKSGNDLLLLVNNILDFSRMEAGKLKLEPVEFDIHQVIESVLEMLAGQAEEKGLLLLGELPLETAWKVRGDEIRLKQILVNLVGNAIKFTHRGEVKVSLAWQKKKASLGEFELQIRDTGIGMDVTAQEQVFSAFFQADNTSTRDYGGSGLGLAIVAQLVDLMGGRISLTSTPDEGSCFRIMLELPLEEQADLSLPEELLRQRVLLCTDRIPPFDQLAARLTSLGMPALIVPSAVETWYQLGAAVRAGKPFELLFCSPDTCLPTGQPLYQGLREDPMFRQLRRILLPPSRFANLSLGRHETKLTPPLVWKDLIQALRTSWQDLHLIDKPRGEKSTRSNSLPAAEEIKDRLLVVGGGVASRELVKLALQNSSCLVESAPDLSDLTIHSSKDYAAILFDLPFLPEGQLKHFFAEKDIHSKILIFYEFEEQIEPYRAWIHVFLKKPFDRKQLQGALEALFSDRVLTHSSKLEGPG